MAEINICRDLAPSGSLLHPRSGDSAVKRGSPPRDWSHRLWMAQAHRTASTCQGSYVAMPTVTHLPQGSDTAPLHTPPLGEDPEPVS